MDHEVKRWPGLSWNNCTLKKTEANDWLCLAHRHTRSHRSVHNKTQSVLLLLCHNETSVGRKCYNFIGRQQLSVLYSTSFQTLHRVPFIIMGHWGKKCLLWSSEIISGCRGLICWGWSLPWDDETSEKKTGEVLAQVCTADGVVSGRGDGNLPLVYVPSIDVKFP